MNENYLIGRASEINILQEALISPEAELIAIYGRRRVGKTYLIRTVYEKEIVFEISGLNSLPMSDQLENFSSNLTTAFNLPVEIAIPKNWLQAFRQLRQLLEPKLSSKKQVVFLDELPWFDTPKSGFLSAFDNFWNSWASKQRGLVVVICGSAASWMIQNIVRSKGGLHNRITRRMRLMPFNLYETELFLQNKYIQLDRYQIIQLFMITGGIPHYLKDIRRGESVVQAVDRLCFTNDGLLVDEFKSLYSALFENADKHILIVRALAQNPTGLMRGEIIDICSLSSGGGLTKLLDELLESGFISEFIPFNKTSKDAIFKLTDEYSLFYLKFIENSKAIGEGAWLDKSISASWKSWSGFAFENICLKHTPQIKKALNIYGIYSEQSAWRYVSKGGDAGTQIDLLIDRRDNCINLCEIKFSITEFTIDKKYAEDLAAKRRIFIAQTSTKKAVFITMITTFGVNNNAHYLNNVQNQLTMNVLFERL
jgi:AAA+ ATPase superfamily predicted ATPase